jgi:DNA repair protein SbcD/Mre11
VDLCLRERVDFLVLAGDLFDAKDRSVRARLWLRRELNRLHGAKIQTFIVHGNHDPLTSEAAGLPDSVKVFGTAWEEAVAARDGQPLCRIQGISYGQERVCEDLSRHFSRRGPEFTVGLLHANVGGCSTHANYAPCTLEDLSARGLDYWALGHVHTRAEHHLESGGLAVYPGNTQGRHVNETGERGCILVDVTDRTAITRFVPVDSIRWHRIELDTSEVTTVEALLSLAEEQVVAACAEPVDGHAVRLTLAGRTQIRGELAKPGALVQLEDQLREVLGARTPPILLESLVDKTLPDLDMAQLASTGGLAGLLATYAQGGVDTRGLLDELWSDEEMKKLDAALHRLALPRTREAAQELVRASGLRALELLLAGEGTG